MYNALCYCTFGNRKPLVARFSIIVRDPFSYTLSIPLKVSPLAFNWLLLEALPAGNLVVVSSGN